jgi:hypothetical protein
MAFPGYIYIINTLYGIQTGLAGIVRGDHGTDRVHLNDAGNDLVEMEMPKAIRNAYSE